MRTRRLNDQERRLWVLNDAYLYSWWRGELRPPGSIQAFIRRHRAELDEYILEQLNRKPRS